MLKHKLWALCLLMVSVAFSQSKSNYWQQKVDYKIKVQLNDKKHTLKGNVEIIYTNNSPNELEYIYFHLYPNAYKNDQTALAKQVLKLNRTQLYFNAKKNGGYIDSLLFKVNGKTTSFEINPDYIDIAKVNLIEPLKPGASVKVVTPFFVKIPKAGISRLSHKKNAYNISQWYPKPAVYDKEGWHRIPNLSLGEFYGEYGDFDVSITLPKNYLITATGNLAGEHKKAEEKFLKEKELYTNMVFKEYPKLDGKKVIQYPKHNFASEEGVKTVRFTEKNVHDFAWFANKNWLVKSSSVKLPNSSERVKTYSFFLPENMWVWSKSVSNIDTAIYYYSLFAGNYPYKTCKAVDGVLPDGGGMEYPTVTIISSSMDRIGLDQVITHEVGHNWFYGIYGSNERVNPWMDEGLNSYFEKKIMGIKYPDTRLLEYVGVPLKFQFINQLSDPLFKDEADFTHRFSVARNEIAPSNKPAVDYSQLGMALLVYEKPALMFRYLEGYLGQQKMHKIFQLYYNRWSFKHPQPHDFVAICEEVAQEKLGWFFDDLLGTNKQLNYAIKVAGVNYETKEYEVVVENKGQIKGPVVLSGILNGKVLKTVWYKGFEGKMNLVFPKGEYDEIVIDYYKDMPEANRSDNRLQVYYLTGRLEPLEFKLFGDFDDPNKTQIFYTPYASYTSGDKFILGAAFYNSLSIEKRFRYLLMPGYSFGTDQFTGSGNLVYSFYPKSTRMRKLNLDFGFKRFGVDAGPTYGYIQKWEPGVTMVFKPKDPLAKVEQSANVRFTQTTLSIPGTTPDQNRYVTANFKYSNKRVINPFEFKLNAQMINEGAFKAWAELEYKLTVNEKLKTVDFRFYGGSFIGNGLAGGRHRFRLIDHNGTEGYAFGMNDYLMDESYLGRYNTSVYDIASQQIGSGGGGFKSGYNVGTSSTWIGAVNVTLPTPIKFLKFFGDFGLHPGATNASTGETDPLDYQYDAGVQVNIVEDYFELYFPLLMSQDIKDNNEFRGANSYIQRVRFMFNMSELYTILR